MKIYLVAIFKSLEDLGSGRTVGYFTTKKDAFACVRNNWGDIHENVYEYAVIEKVEPGLYQYDENPTFFKWVNDGFDGYEKIKRPEEANGFIGFTIG